MQVRQVWQYGENAPERLYSYFIGDADSLPVTGNRLLVLGGVSYVNGASSASLGLGPSHSRIIEVEAGSTWSNGAKRPSHSRCKNSK